MIEGRALRFARNGKVILDGAEIAVANGTVVGLVGPNGSGKTTLLRLLYGALAADAGQVRLDGADIKSMRRRDIARRIAVVPQERVSDDGQTLADFVMLGRMPHRSVLAALDSGDYRATCAALARVGLSRLHDQSLARLSGGEMQRALIARALCQEADHLLLDEPTNHLDLRYQHDILTLVRALACTTVVVLHDLNLAARYCDQLVVMDKGRVVAAGTPDTVLVRELIEPIYGIGMSRARSPSGAIYLIFE